MYSCGTFAASDPTIWGTVLHAKFLWLCVALALWGLGQGAGPVSEALLADSTRQGVHHHLDFIGMVIIVVITVW